MSKVAPLIIADIETSGLIPTVNAITEIALTAIDSITLEEMDRYESVIAPYDNKNGPCVYEPKALSYSGMTMDQINKGQSAKVVANELEAFFKKNTVKMRFGMGKPILCGHNFLLFDKPHIDHFMWLFNKVKLKTVVLDEKNKIHQVDYDSTLYQKETFDTLNWTRHTWVGNDALANNKLATACEAVGIPLMDAHRAMNDTEANRDLMKYYLQSLRTGTTEKKKEERVRDTFKF